MSEITYKELNLPNISYDEYAKASSRTVVGVSYFMHPFIEALAIKHPEWKFVAHSGSRVSAESVEAWSFKVYEKRELLGSLSQEWFGREYAYGLRNDRIGQALQRGYSRKTTKLDKAIKLTEKSFFTKNSNELYHDAVQVSDQIVGRFAQNKVAMVNARWRNLLESTQGYAMRNWSDFVNTLDTEKAKLAVDMPMLIEEASKVDHIYLSFKRGQTYNIVITGSDYIVGEGDEITIVAGDKLPEVIRRRLGMLKLIPNGDVLAGSGARVNDNTFVVLKEI